MLFFYNLTYFSNYLHHIHFLQIFTSLHVHFFIFYPFLHFLYFFIVWRVEVRKDSWPIFLVIFIFLHIYIFAQRCFSIALHICLFTSYPHISHMHFFVNLFYTFLHIYIMFAFLHICIITVSWSSSILAFGGLLTW